jgi:hypothetical protein
MTKKNKLNEPLDGHLEPKEFRNFFEDCQKIGVGMKITSTIDKDGLNKTTINVPPSSRFKVTKALEDGALSKYGENFGIKKK